MSIQDTLIRLSRQIKDSALDQQRASDELAALKVPPGSDPLFVDTYTLPVSPPASLWYIAGGHTWSATNTRGHVGLDINLTTGGDTDLGEPVYATCNGLVVYAQKAPGNFWGNVVVVQSMGAAGLEYWRYAHLDTIDVQLGDYVFPGDSIGTIGKGGLDRYWAHLHLGMWRGPIQSPSAYRNRGVLWTDPLIAWQAAGVEFDWGERR